MVHLGIAWHGNASFVKHGILSPTCYNLLEKVKFRGWNQSNEEWQEKGRKEQEATLGWGEPEAETIKRWENADANWVKVPLPRINTDYVDPQAQN